MACLDLRCPKAGGPLEATPQEELNVSGLQQDLPSYSFLVGLYCKAPTRVLLT